MNFKTTAVLLILALTIGAYFYFVERNSPSTLEREKIRFAGDPEEGTPLFTVDQLSAPDIDHLTIQTGDTKAELERTGLDWYQTQPVRFALDSWSVQPTIDAAAGLRYSRKFIPGQADMPKLDELELSPPKAIVTIATTAPKPAKFVIKVGKSGSGGRGYVMIDDQPEVYVVTDALHKAVVEQKAVDWRRHTLPSPHESLTQRIEYTRPGAAVANPSLAGQAAAPSSFIMTRHEGQWTLDGNDRGRIDADKVRELLDSLASVHIDKFIVDAPAHLAEYGLDRPAMVIQCVSTPAPPTPLPGTPGTPGSPGSPGTPATTQPATQPADTTPIVQSLSIGAPVDMNDEAYFATWSDKDQPGNIVFTILKTDYQKLDKSINDFRDPRVTALDTRDIREVTIARGREKLALERDDKGAWSFRPPSPGFAADSDAVADLLDSLSLARAVNFVPNAKPPGSPIAEIRLAAAGQRQPDVITVYPAPEGSASSGDEAQDLVLCASDTTGLLVPSDRLTRILAPVITLRDRLVLDIKPDQIRSVKIKRSGLPAEDAVVNLTQTPAPRSAQPATTPANTPPGHWEISGPETAIVASGGKSADGAPNLDHNSLDALLAAIAPLHAQAWTAGEAPDKSDIMSVIELEVTLAGGQTRSARIYPDSNLGAIPGVDAYFRVDKAVIEALQAEFLDRKIIDVDVDDLKQVSVIDQPVGAAARTLVIVRDNLGAFHCTQAADLSQANAGALFDVLASLHAERYVKPPALGPDAPGRSLHVETKRGKIINLRLPVGAMQGLNRIAGVVQPNGATRWFQVSDDAATKLHADIHMPARTEDLPPAQ